ncbi:MAG: CRISPR-associated helicase Cas3', partial [Bacteroidetes bacterium]
RMENRSDREKLNKFNESPEWETLRQHAVQLLRSHFVSHWPETLPEPENVSAAIVALNGFCILCDWLGSDENYFTPKPNMPLAEYIVHSRQQAYRRVKDAGLLQTAVSHTPATFSDLFPFPPRPLQTLTDQIPASVLLRPVLIIIEAPTGEGKTETALALARRIAALRGTDEMYIALPTTATSNAMYTRIQEHLRNRLGLPPELVQLVHGQSFLVKDDLTIKPLENADGEEEAAQEWFAPKKKALLAPFGVGTIDQAMLSAMNVKHNALRQIGLAGKVIILDEVHAYDTYMTTIIKRMLSWLAALGSSVILLSATLPQRRRQELIESFAGSTVSLPCPDRYPSLIAINTAGELYTPDREISVYQPNKTIQLERLYFTEEQAAEKAQWLWQQVQNGGCAAWITNTVDRAIAIHKALQHIVSDDVDVSLLHGRLPQEQRQELETQIIGKYGKNGTRPAKGIVVGTQVLEQSL